MREISLDLISPSPNPIRKTWDEDKMDELAQSIKEHGVIVAIKVRPIGAGVTFDPDTGEVWRGHEVHYEVVYGHRRVEAARLAGLDEVPAIVEAVEDTDTLIQALIENVQREDMEPVDLGKALKRMMDLTGANTMDIERSGLMSHTNVSYHISLLDETKEVQGMISKHEGGNRVTHKKSRSGATIPSLSVTHVRSAREAGIKEPKEREMVLRKAANNELTYRETRAVADAYVKASTPEKKQAVLEVDLSKSKGWTGSSVLRKAERDVDDEFFEEVEREIKRDRYQELPRMAKEFLDAGKGYEKEIDLVRGAINSGVTVFSPEGKGFVTRRINSVISKLEHLMEVVNE